MPKKFLFDTSFEAPGDDAPDAQASADRRPKYFDEDLERAQQEGIAAGREAGEREARQAIEQQIAQTLGSISQQLVSLGQAQAEASERQGRDSMEAAMTTVRKLFPILARSQGLAEVEALVAECLERVRDEPRIVVRVCDSLLDPVRDRVEALAARVGFDGRFVLLAQDGLNPGDVRVEWPDGGAERDSGRLWHDIDEVIERTMGTAFTSRVRAALSEAGVPVEPPAAGPKSPEVAAEPPPAIASA